jgi:hypothetical protein
MFSKPHVQLCIFVLLSTTLACSLTQTSQPTASPSPTETVPVSSPTTPVQTETVEPTPSAAPPLATLSFTQTPPAPAQTPADLPEEAIFILEPGSGSRVTSPVQVTGMADSTFEQNLVVHLLLDDGSQLAFAPTTIQSEMGQRGPFELELPFDVEGERQGFIQVYASSPRDGAITHPASVGVTLASSGSADIRPVTPYQERIVIYQPAVAQTISGGVAHVEGFALASFEQTLVVEVFDVNGKLVGMQPVIVQAPDLGIPGPFSVDVPYQGASAGPGRIVVRDPSPAFEGDYHLASVEVNLEPDT